MTSKRYLTKLARMADTPTRRPASSRCFGARAMSEHTGASIDGLDVIAEVEAPLRPARLIASQDDTMGPNS
jgi:hypothetical protein